MPHDPYAAPRSRNYRLFALGFLPSSMGLQMLATAIGWEVYERTGSAMALGYVGLARALPVVLIALPAGHFADTHDRRRVMVVTQWLFSVGAAALALASRGEAHILSLYAILAILGGVRAFNGPARSSLLPLIVRDEDFHNAVTWNSGVFQASAMLGPLAAGALIAATGEAWPVYACTAIGCALFAILGAFIRPVATQTRSTEPFAWSHMFAGLSHLWKEKTVLAALTLDLFAVILGGATALMPIYAKDILHAGPVGLGALRAAPFVGALVMSIILAYRRPFERAGPALLFSVAGFGLCTIVFGVSTSLILSLAMLALLGALDNISVVIRHVLVQVRTPDALRGRVSAVNAVFIDCSNELGAYESGLIARFFGPAISVVSGGIGTILVVLGIAALIPEIRRLGRLTTDAPIDEKSIPGPGSPLQSSDELPA